MIPIIGRSMAFQWSSHAFFRLLAAKLPQRAAVLQIKWLSDSTLVWTTTWFYILKPAKIEESQSSDQIVDADLYKSLKPFWNIYGQFPVHAYRHSLPPVIWRVQRCPCLATSQDSQSFLGESDIVQCASRWVSEYDSMNRWDDWVPYQLNT